MLASGRHASAEQIETWLITALAACLQRPAAEVDPEAAFADQGLDSVSAVSLSGDLGSWLGRNVEATMAWDFPSIRKLAVHLAGTD